MELQIKKEFVLEDSEIKEAIKKYFYEKCASELVGVGDIDLDDIKITTPDGEEFYASIEIKIFGQIK